MGGPDYSYAGAIIGLVSDGVIPYMLLPRNGPNGTRELYKLWVGTPEQIEPEYAEFQDGYMPTRLYQGPLDEQGMCSSLGTSDPEVTDGEAEGLRVALMRALLNIATPVEQGQGGIPSPIQLPILKLPQDI
jgi:hypothetical protein